MSALRPTLRDWLRTGDPDFWFAEPAVGGQTISPVAIASAEALGEPTVANQAPGQILSPVAIASAEAFGAPTITPATPQTLAPVAIPSAEAFGLPTVALVPAGPTAAQHWPRGDRLPRPALGQMWPRT